MRVISGKYRSLKLVEFGGSEIRPTADRVKESLFNILSDVVRGARVLDLFCGSGSLGIECISRGAAFVRFNDSSPKSLAVLSKNLSKLKNESNYDVTCSDFSVCLSRGEKFDIIFLDPPYKSDAGIRALEVIALKRLLTENGVCVFERDRAFTEEIAGAELFDERRYGITYLDFLRLKA